MSEPRAEDIVVCTMKENSYNDRTNKQPKRLGISVPAIAAAFLVVVFMIAITAVLVSLYLRQAQLIARVETLERELVKLNAPCGNRHVEQTEQRDRKFGWFSKATGERHADFHLGKPASVDVSASKIHPIQHAKTDGTVTASTRVLLPGDRGGSDTVKEELPEIHNRIKRGPKGGGKNRGRSSSNKSKNKRFEEIRGAHFEANLNRTTTIGVGEAGWLPHWSLSTSIGYHQNQSAVLANFRLHARGNVTVAVAGLYYVYSQMMYYDPNEYIGHSIMVNGVELFTCIAPVEQRQNKYKTCFIGGLVYVPENSQIGIKMLYTPRQVCLFEDTSYFGMFRVS
ncbi:uncharacterized protein [Diadema antillarum]|uniref:uncharacterized protein isoform X1 n=1 Tax=Diadema antillarum TaxID=105358 RepID=UPI003A8AF556